MRTYKTTKAILRHAAKLIDECGLAKWYREDSKGRLCVHGAIQMAASGNAYGNNYDAENECAGRIYDYLSKRSPGMVKDCGPTNVAPWNNAPGRKKYQVVRALLRAAERVW